MVKLTKDDQARIEAAVAEVEAGTAAEVICIVAKQSEDFRLIGLAWAAVLSLAVPWFLLLTPWPVMALLVAQLAVFLVLAFCFTQTPALKWFVPREWARREAMQAAREQFLLHGLHRSADRTGVLLYVSLAEHYAEILVDVGLEEKVDPAVWKEAVDAICRMAKSGRIADGVVAALAICAPALAVVAPITETDVDELPNRPIII